MRRRTLWITVLALLVATSAALAYDSFEAAMKDWRAQYGARKYKEAADAAKQAAELAKTPKDKASALTQVAECQLRLRKYLDAEKTSKDVLALEGLSANQKALAQYKLAYAVERQGAKRRTESIALFEKILALPGASLYYQTIARIRLGWLYYATKQYDKALAAAQWIVDQPKVSTSPKCEASEILAVALNGQKKPAEAAQAIEKALKTPKLSPYWQGRLHFALGVYLSRAGKDDDALAVLDKGARIEKGHPYYRARCYLETARIQMKRKDYAKAKAACEAVLAIPKVHKRHVNDANKVLARIKKATAGK